MKKVHFIGIGGYGMSALANVALDLGWHVTGSDVALSPLAKKLQERGATVHIGHDGAYVHEVDEVIYSTAVAADNPEMVTAKQLNKTVLHRSEFLARFINEGRGVAFAGAHGKTTTSSMAAVVTRLSCIDATYVVGGEVINFGTNAAAGHSDVVIAEADESDGTFLNYYPKIGVITNIEPDHLENYNHNYEQLRRAYRQFMEQVQDVLIVCGEDKEIVDLTCEGALRAKVVYYGRRDALVCDHDADNLVIIDDVNLNALGSTFTLTAYQLLEVEHAVEVTLNVPGEHNVLNATAVLMATHYLDIALEYAVIALQQFTGAKRRFQILAKTADDIWFVDDYAHHPTEIKATLAAAKATGKRIVVAFQPQRYTRTQLLFDEFAQAFADADEAWILDVYSPAGETFIAEVTTEKLVEKAKTYHFHHLTHVPTKQDVLKYAQTLKAGDLFISMGAGDIWQVGHQLAQQWPNIVLT